MPGLKLKAKYVAWRNLTLPFFDHLGYAWCSIMCSISTQWSVNTHALPFIYFQWTDECFFRPCIHLSISDLMQALRQVH